MHPTQPNQQPSLESVPDNPSASPASPASSHHATVTHPSPATSSHPESINTRPMESSSGGSIGGGMSAHQSSGVMSISGRDATGGGNIMSTTGNARFSLATGDRKLAFGQLRQAVSSQLCDLLDDAGISATRIVSGRRFVRWDTLPAFLAKLNLYISNLPFDFFFAKTGADWPPAPRPPPGGGKGSSDGRNEHGSRGIKSPLGNSAIDEEMQDSSSDPSRSGDHSPLGAKADVRTAPSSTKLKYDPQTIIAQLHAQPLNINILSWKKQTIEELLAALNRGDIRVASRPQGRDVVFELLTPDGQVIDIPKWPDIYPLRQSSPLSFQQQQQGQYTPGISDHSHPSFGIDPQASSQVQHQTHSRSQLNNQINYRQDSGGPGELFLSRSQSQFLGEENERTSSQQQQLMSKFRSRPHSLAPPYPHSRTGSYSDSQGEGQTRNDTQGPGLEQHPSFSKIQFPALTPSEMVMAANPYAPYSTSREGSHGAVHTREGSGSGVIRTVRPERERRRRLSAAAALERSAGPDAQGQDKFRQNSGDPIHSGEHTNSSTPTSTSSDGKGSFSRREDPNDESMDEHGINMDQRAEKVFTPVKREKMEEDSSYPRSPPYSNSGYLPKSLTGNQRTQQHYSGFHEHIAHGGRTSHPSHHSHPPPLKPAAPSNSLLAPGQAFNPSMSTSATFLSAPTPTKKWTRRSSPDRIFMNLTLNSLLRSAGMPIPRQKDDASRLPWSSIPHFLAEKGLYLTAWPEANLPWLYSGDSNPSQGAGRGTMTSARGRGGALGVGEWRDRIDWKSSPSQRSYKPLAQALRNGEIRILPRPPGRDVIFEVKDAQGRFYDSTLGLSDDWKMKYMYGDGISESSTIVSGLNAGGGGDIAMNDSDEEMEEDDGNVTRGRPGYDSRSRSHAQAMTSDPEQPSPTDTAETVETIETQWTSKTYPQYSPSPASPGSFSGQPNTGSLPGISSLTRPSSFGSHPLHSSSSSSSSPQPYPASSPLYTQTRFNPRSSQLSSGSFPPEPLYPTSSPFRNNGASDFKIPPRYASASPIPYRQYAESTARFQRPLLAESAVRGEEAGSRSPSPHSSTRQRTTSLGTSGASSGRPHSAAAMAASNSLSLPPFAPQSLTEGETLSHNRLPPISVALQRRERENSGSYKNVHLPPLTSATTSTEGFIPYPSRPIPINSRDEYSSLSVVGSNAGASRSSNPYPPSSSSNSTPTHLPEPPSAFPQPVWSAQERAWRLPITDEVRSVLPSFGDTLLWDARRRVWALVLESQSSQNMHNEPPTAYWSLEQRAWVLDS